MCSACRMVFIIIARCGYAVMDVMTGTVLLATNY